ncbi:hypothetical protein NT6N_29510 [Oceaniferula spumae]|uniref:Lipoprotein n=1 Tax=Oceaniferula spumae TaxID=2979115 RepID=A0AAT9FPJ2_9BACT
MKQAYLFSLAATLTFAACGPSGSGNSAWNAAVSASYQGLNTVADTSSVSIPVLQSKSFAASWGKPKVEVNAAGGYRLSYSDPSQPFNRMEIYGSASALPSLSSPPKLESEEMVDGELSMVESAQSWRTVTIAGKTVRFYKVSNSGGADGAYYSTEGFSLTGPDGKVGHYRLVAEAGDDESSVRRRFSSAGF